MLGDLVSCKFRRPSTNRLPVGLLAPNDFASRPPWRDTSLGSVVCRFDLWVLGECPQCRLEPRFGPLRSILIRRWYDFSSTSPDLRSFSALNNRFSSAKCRYLAPSLDLRLEVAAQVKPANLSVARVEHEIGLGSVAAGNAVDVVAQNLGDHLAAAVNRSPPWTVPCSPKRSIARRVADILSLTPAKGEGGHRAVLRLRNFPVIFPSWSFASLPSGSRTVRSPRSKFLLEPPP